MNGITTMTQKGQITIPADVRRQAGMRPHGRVSIKFIEGKVVAEPVEDILDVARRLNLKAPKGKNALKAREWMETHYERA